MIYYILYSEKLTEQDYETIYRKLVVRLPEFRQKKAEMLNSIMDRCNCVLSYLLLLHALKEEGYYKSTGSDKISFPEFSIGEHGKPFFADTVEYNNIFFNLSHTARGVACVLDKTNVGIDILETRKVSDFVKKKFDSNNMSNSEFCRLFSGYEAFAKYTGKGITTPFAQYKRLSEDLLNQQKLVIKTFELPVIPEAQPDSSHEAVCLSVAYEAGSDLAGTTPIKVLLEDII